MSFNENARIVEADLRELEYAINTVNETVSHQTTSEHH